RPCWCSPLIQDAYAPPSRSTCRATAPCRSARLNLSTASPPKHAACSEASHERVGGRLPDTRSGDLIRGGRVSPTQAARKLAAPDPALRRHPDRNRRMGGARPCLQCPALHRAFAPDGRRHIDL